MKNTVDWIVEVIMLANKSQAMSSLDFPSSSIPSSLAPANDMQWQVLV